MPFASINPTNPRTLASPLLMRPQGSQMRQDPPSKPVEVWCAKIALKLKNIKKTLRNQGAFPSFFSILKVV